MTLAATKGDIYAGTYTDVLTSNYSKQRSFLGGLLGSSSQHDTVDRINTGTDTLAALDLSLLSGTGTTLVGATLSAGRTLNIETGDDFSVQAAIDSHRSEFFSTNMGLVTMTTIQELSFVETAVLTELLAGQALTFGTGGAAELILYQQAGVDAPTPDDLYPEELLAIAGLQLFDQKLANDYFYDEQRQMSPAFKALVSLVVTQGIGALAGGAGFANGVMSIQQSWLATAVDRFAATFVIGSPDRAVLGNLHLGDILEGAAFSGVTAGLTAGMDLNIAADSSLNNALIDEFGNGRFTVEGLVSAGLDGVLASGLSSAVYGTDFGDGVLSQVVGYIANGVAGAADEDVADVNGHDMFTVEKLVAKATLNCLAAEAKYPTCGSSALSSLVTETLTSAAMSGDATLTSADIERLRRNIELVSAIMGYFASGGEAENVYATITAAHLDYGNC